MHFAKKQGRNDDQEASDTGFLGDAGLPLFAMRYDPGVARRLPIFCTTVPKVTGNFLALFEMFEAWFVLRERKTATVSIEFSKEVKYSMQEKETSPK